MDNNFNFERHFDIDEDGILAIDPSIQYSLTKEELKDLSLILDVIGTNSSKVNINYNSINYIN